MRFSPRTWSLLSLLLFIGAVFFWMKGDEREAARRRGLKPAATSTNQIGKKTSLVPSKLLTELKGAAPATPANSSRTNRFPYRLTNTEKSLDELIQSDSALLLRNAFIETAGGRGLAIPAHLKSEGKSVSYVVQARGPVNQNFRKLLQQVRAEIVSYVPNNAYLVTMDAEGAEQLKGSQSVQTVMPFEPYFKLDEALLAKAVKKEPLAQGAYLRVTVFPAYRESALKAFQNLGAEVHDEEGSPFGPQFVVKTDPNGLVALAQTEAVQGIEPVRLRVAANELTRVQLGISTDTVTNGNYLDLTGTNIWVNMNDTGVDTNHMDIKGRVFTPFNFMNPDTNGHGTFVAATILGNGDRSVTVSTNIASALTNANFRGMAPMANLFALPIDFAPEVNISISDSYIQETAARTNYFVLDRTNTLISNNSWVYDGASEYDSAAARYDLAVRDAVPGATNSQPVLYVFPSGNAGFGQDDGLGGESGGVLSPGTAKNVITVGAVEHLRLVTNSIMVTNIIEEDGEFFTNIVEEFPLMAITDSDTEVASFSSRGNVGIGTEGPFGRFKPDVVAPGVFIVSAKSKDYKIEDHFDTNTTLGEMFVNLQTNLTEYRIDLGTTYAAPAVSGMLALVQEFFEQRLESINNGTNRTLSPALMKALLVNGSRSVNPIYDLNVRNTINYQGWGLPNIQRMIPAVLATNSEPDWPIRLIEQTTTNAVATGESRTWRLSLSTNALFAPLRVTLVWTDPPGNPSVAVKLVNDLDLEVRSVQEDFAFDDDSNFIFYGNNIGADSDFTGASTEDETPRTDFVNNVENVFISNPRELGTEATNFVITVRGRRVNVNSTHDYNALTQLTNDVRQDFAIVISTDDPSIATPFTLLELQTKPEPLLTRPVISLTNGLPLLNQRVGANPSLMATNGVAQQWSFYEFDNTYRPENQDIATVTNGHNVAFLTFAPPNLSTPRHQEADIDIYVSRDQRLFNLDPAVLAASLKSVERGGTEAVIMTNALTNVVYYIAVKAEDQKAAEFSLIGVSANYPFEQEDSNGNRILEAVPVSGFLMDGAANNPAATVMVAIGLSNKRIQRTVVSNIITHENLGDLFGVLEHRNQNVVLNNHTLNNGDYFGTQRFLYDDSGLPPLSTVPSLITNRPTDGPGSLNNFLGDRIQGQWMLHMIDDSPSHTGRVERLTLYVQPLRDNLLPGVTVAGNARSKELVFYPIDVPVGVINLIINVRQTNGSTLLPLETYLRFDQLPTTNVFDAKGGLTNGVVQLYHGISDVPPLRAGENFLGIYNPNIDEAGFFIDVFFEYGETVDTAADLTYLLPTEIRDDATTNSIIEVRQDKAVADVEVGLRIDHPRVSDLTVSLTSPQGSRLLLTEARGGRTADAFGTSYNVGNSVETAYAVFTERTNLARVPIKFAKPPFKDTTNLRGLIQTMNFDNVTAGNYDAGQTLDVWDVTLNTVSVLDQDYRTYQKTRSLLVAGAALTTDLPTVPGRSYRLEYVYRANPGYQLLNTGVDDKGLVLTNLALDLHHRAIVSSDPDYLGPELYVVKRTNRLFPAQWFINSTISEWIVLNTNLTEINPVGPYVVRTHFGLNGYDASTAVINGRWASSQEGMDILLNGASLKITSAGPGNLSPPFTINSGFVAGINTLDYIVTNRNQLFGLRTEVQLNTPTLLPGVAVDPIPNGFVTLQGETTNNVVGYDEWRTNVVEFIGSNNPNGTTLELRADLPGLLFDDIRLIDTGIVYYQPEESLEIFENQRSVGEWKLEVLDERTGLVVNPHELISWELNLHYAQPAPPAEELVHGKTYPGITNVVTKNGAFEPGKLHRTEIQYFIVEACPGETKATVTLVGEPGKPGRLLLFADQSGLPTGDPLTDDYVPVRNDDNNSTATFVLDTKSPAPAPLRPGKRFFLAVANYFASETNTFDIRVDFDNPSCVPVAPTRLRANLVHASSLASSATESSDDYVVEVSSEMSSAEIEVSSDSGDVGVLVSKGSIPTSSGYNYAQDKEGTGSEIIALNRNSSPTPLSPGPWYIKVYNNSPFPALYQIKVTADGAAPRVNAVYENGHLRFSWISTPGKQYRIDTSTNLKTWSQVTTVPATGELTSYSETASTGQETARFFRIVEL